MIFDYKKTGIFQAFFVQKNDFFRPYFRVKNYVKNVLKTMKFYCFLSLGESPFSVGFQSVFAIGLSDFF